MQNSPEIVIIGGGLSGLCTAYLLQKKGMKAQILEARSSLGGRIRTLRPDRESHIEMGATWLGRKHHHLLDLLDELNVEIEEQFMGDKGYYEPMSTSPPQLVNLPPAEEPSFRISGGTDRLILALADRLDKESIHLNKPVKTVRSTDSSLVVETGSTSMRADFVISTLPPKLLAGQVEFSPSLPDKLMDIASKTHTWMAESIKVALRFSKPFWRDTDSSGTIFSNVGPVNEMYDHSGNGHYALKGFINSAYHTVSRDERKKLVIEQLRRFYGKKVDAYLSYHERVWQNEPYSFSKYEHPVIPHQNSGHSIFNYTLFDRRLLVSGSETASEFPGYMDGAVESARSSARQIARLLS